MKPINATMHNWTFLKVMLKLIIMSNDENILTLLRSPFDSENGQLRLVEMSGEDSLSSPFYFSLTALASNVSLDLQKLLGQSISFRLGSLSGEHTVYHGLIYHATQSSSGQDERSITLLIQPWFRFLADKVDSRIFSVEKPLTIPQIVTAVFKNNGYFDYTLKLSKTYQPLDICVQYNESDFNFVSRLLKQAGIYYYFTHTETTHTMVLTDAPFPNLAKPVPAHYSSDTHTNVHISQWRAIATPSIETMNTQRFDFKNPDLLVSSQQKSALKQSGLPKAFLANVFQYDELPTDASETQLSDLLKQKLTAHATSSRYVAAQSYYPTWQAGTAFTLQNHDVAQQAGDYYIYAIAHSVKDRSGLSSDTNEASSQHYQNTFRAYKTSQTFVPEARYQSNLIEPDDRLVTTSPALELDIAQPKISGLHTATVVGPKNTPIFTDKYGRVKVQFDWDAHSKGDENSFTWIRMKQRRGSEQLGAHFTPRVGQEVLVSFDHVDSNKPAIVGAMPSDSSQPPFTPHKTPAQLGLRSKSLASDAMQQAIPGHQLLFDDDSAQPQVHLHSYKDLDVTTNNDYALDVGGKTTTTIKKGDHTQTVGGKYVINAEKAVHIINGESRISITPTDITIEANKISLGGGANTLSGSAAKQSLFPLSGTPQNTANTSEKLTNNVSNTKTIHYWLALHYPHLNNTVTPPAQSFSISTQISPQQKATEVKSFSGSLNKKSIGSVAVDKSLTISHVQLTNSDIISINKKATPYPQPSLQTKASDWKNANTDDLPGATLKPGDKQLQAEVLFPIIVKNLRETPRKNTPHLLTDDEINYFKKNGNNAMIFIHGFNVPFGEFPRNITDVEIGTDDINSQLDVTYGPGNRTVYSDLSLMKKRFPDVASVLNLDNNIEQLPYQLSSSTNPGKDTINGTDAHNWFLHMEDNFNRATNQFKRDDYTKYSRCIHIAWSGDFGVTEYILTEPHADSAGENVVPLLKQLSQHKIDINIVAHSLGNRVLLRAMSLLGKTHPNLLDHVFLWEPAVPATALSSNERQQLLNKPTDQFLNAAEASKKITVLYSKNDSTLSTAYYAAKAADVNDTSNQAHTGLTTLLATQIAKGGASSQPTFSAAPRTIAGYNDLVIQHRCLGWLAQKDSSPAIKEKYQQVCTDLYHHMQELGAAQALPALGFDGLDSQREDSLVQQMIASNKLIPANMTPYSTGHSYMHIPDEQVMIHGYKTYIMNKIRGVNSFGLYSKARFPDYPIDAFTTPASNNEQGRL